MTLIKGYIDIRDSALQERVNILRKSGYRGWIVTGMNRYWGGVQVTAVNNIGESILAEGESLDEAYENTIEKIDYTMDDQPYKKGESR